ncbi:uncharacterized protein T551_02770 [Pneumocystis jirovecii RU7]|uniref:Nuclear distribution protein PAC1 n=1 Tax=Pneumocystis jirovecii (strain RU7) TaxID=1408657 RepID=A0A0W4ZJ03_PNEJ7|nr:uncharacterized protein T551_02770 [Pneumocystis jirovecii RU7]KTW28351.1 hypothetical protein T551_02770 [Pneumocystis jirovecii RU7]
MSHLSDRQREELYKALLSYFSKSEFPKTFLTFKSELSNKGINIDINEENEHKYDKLLEKKWSSVIRLQKKIMDLETQLHTAQTELSTIPSDKNYSEDISYWIPRAPARHTLTGHRQSITSVAFHPVFTILASAAEDSTIKIWDWETGDFERTLKGHTKAVLDIDFNAFSDSNYLVSCSSDLTIKLWDSENDYKNIKTFYGHDHSISSVKFLPPSGDRIVSVSRDRNIKIWEISTGFCTKTISSAHIDWIRTICPSDDGKLLLSAGNDRIAKIFDVYDGECKLEFQGHEHVIECAIFAPNSAFKFLTELSGIHLSKNSTGYIATGSRDKTIKLWGCQTGQMIKTLSGHDNWLRALVFHPSGRYLISASDDKTIRCWDLSQSGKCTRIIKEAHSHFISCLRCTPNLLKYSTTNKSNKVSNKSSNSKKIAIASGGVDLVIRIWMP